MNYLSFLVLIYERGYTFVSNSQNSVFSGLLPRL